MGSKGIEAAMEDRVFNRFINIILVLTVFVVLYPLYFIIIASISDPDAVNAGKTILLPQNISLISYKMILNEKSIWVGYRNTVLYTVFGTLFSLLQVIPAGYALSRKDMPFRNFIMKYFVFTMFFGGGLIPTYLVVKQLNLVNTPIVLAMLGAVSVFNIIIARTYFQNTIPVEFYEAASIDGCNNMVFFLKIILPLSKAIVAVIALYVAVGHWNQYFNALIYISKKELYPLQMVIRDILLSSQMAGNGLSSDTQEMEALRKASEAMKYSIIIVSSLPVLIAYPFLQGYFVKGVMIGSIKG